MSTIKVSMKLREINFGRPQPEEITHIAVTMIPAIKHETVYLPVSKKQEGAYWSNRDAGTSGNWWKFFAELPEEFSTKKVFDGENGDFVAFPASYDAEFGFYVYED